jgi:RNA polymerase sigma factor (sigma-70 family)
VRRTIDDTEAIARSRDGDLDAYAVLVARYTLRAHRAAFLLGAGEESDDVVQEAFVKAFRHLSRFRAGEPFAPWLLRIVANETRNLTRSRRRRTALALRLSATEPPGPAAGGPVDEVLAAERRTQLTPREHRHRAPTGTARPPAPRRAGAGTCHGGAV